MSTTPSGVTASSMSELQRKLSIPAVVRVRLDMGGFP